MNDSEKNVAVESEQAETATPKKKRSVDIVALVLCLIVSISIWIYVENTARTETTREIKLSVDIAGQIYDSTGMTIFSNAEGQDYSNYQITVTVKGLENVLDKYTSEDYRINIRTDEIQGGAVQTLYFDVVMPTSEITLDKAPALESLYIDKEAEKILSVDGELSVVVKNPNLGKDATIISTPMSDKIVIKGPERTVNKIAKAELTADIIGITTSTVFTTEDIKFLDIDGNPIVTTYVSLTPSAVNIDLKIYDEREFNVSFSPSNKVDGGYMYELAIVGDAKIKLKGDTALMPHGNFVIDFKEDMTKIEQGTIKLKDIVLPEGLELGAGMEDVEISYVVAKKSITVESETTGENS